MSDRLFDILAQARAEMPDAPADYWQRLEQFLRERAGGRRLYVNAPSTKKSRIEAIAAAGADADMTLIAARLGISVRHAIRLKSMIDMEGLRDNPP